MGGNMCRNKMVSPWKTKGLSWKGKADEDMDLTPKEKELVRGTWDILSQKRQHVACEIFLRIFELEPATKQLFPFRNAVGEALIKHPMFKGHATRFINAVHSTVNNLDAWEVILIPTLLALGRTHTRIPAFKLQYLETFMQAILDVWARELGRQWTPEAKAAWRKIFSLIAMKVEEGYSLELPSSSEVSPAEEKVPVFSDSDTQQLVVQTPNGVSNGTRIRTTPPPSTGDGSY